MNNILANGGPSNIPQQHPHQRANLAGWYELGKSLSTYTRTFCNDFQAADTGLNRGSVMPEISNSGGPSSGHGITSRLSLAVKLYSIFAFLAFLPAPPPALPNNTPRHNTELTEAVETASRAALNVERVNSLVYAVVMESRGVYMSTEPADVKKDGEGLLQFNDKILAVVKNWESIVRADDAEQFAAFKKRIEQFVEFRKELVRR